MNIKNGVRALTVSGGPCLQGLGSTLVLANYQCAGNVGWYH